jgi:hypothetical protein
MQCSSGESVAQSAVAKSQTSFHHLARETEEGYEELQPGLWFSWPSFERGNSRIKTKQTPWPLVRERTIPTDRPPRVEEIYCQLVWIEGCRVVSAAESPRPLISVF